MRSEWQDWNSIGGNGVKVKHLETKHIRLEELAIVIPTNAYFDGKEQ